MTIPAETHAASRKPRRVVPALMLALVLPMTACDLDNLLDIDDPDVATPESLRDPAAVPVIYAGALSDFSVAFAGSGATGGGEDGEGQILVSGLLSDEFIATGTFGTRIEIDRRDILTDPGALGVSDNATLEESYQQLHDARVAAENGADLFLLAELGDDPRRSELFSLAGYTYTFFGENYCEGVPFSRATIDGRFEFEGPSTMDETFQRAIARFDSALSLAPADSDAEHLALVGKARALVDLGQLSEAAAVAAEVPTDWSYTLFFSENTPLQENGVWHYAQENGRYGVSDREGGAGLPYRSAADPRVPWIEATRPPFDNTLSFPYFAQAKYPTRGAEVELATGIEARLIEAEAAFESGPAGAALAILNDLRTRVPGLEPLEAPLTRDTLFSERAFWLWLTSHRLGDMRRLVRQYGVAPGTVYPSGDYFRSGLTYGADLQLPIHQTELQNPQFQGCLSRDP